jgi:HSP20 family protein
VGDVRNDSQEEEQMRALTPWTGMTGMRKEMDRLFERFLEPMWSEMPALGEWEPKLDVTETKDAVIVKAELPGVEQKDIAVSLQDGVLTIKGEKESEKEEKDKQYHRVERSHGAFYLPCDPPAGGGRGRQGNGRVQGRRRHHHAPEGAGGQGDHDSGEGRLTCA